MSAVTFETPGRLWLLLLLGPVIVGYLVALVRRSRAAVRLPTAGLLNRLAPPRGRWRRHVAAAILIVALAAIVVALAGPAREERVDRRIGTVVVALDTSTSMRASDISPSRLVAAQRAAVRFVETLPPGVAVGVVTFADRAVVQVPPTRDRDAVRSAIRRVPPSDGTAIGEAVYRSIEAVEEYARVRAARGVTVQVRDAALVMLSDGTSTVGRAPEEAGAEARARGIRVATIAYGTSEGAVVVDGTLVPAPVAADSLRALAEVSRGEHYAAVTTQELDAVYATLSRALGTRVEPRDLTSVVLVAAAVVLTVAVVAATRSWSRLP